MNAPQTVTTIKVPTDKEGKEYTLESDGVRVKITPPLMFGTPSISLLDLNNAVDALTEAASHAHGGTGR